jgi:hypothetical protein
MYSTIPADLLELKSRFETWRTNRKYVREPIPDELWNAAAGLTRRYPTSLVGRALKLDPSKLKKLLIKRSARASVRKKRQAAFFQLSTGMALPEVEAPLPQIPIGCRLQIERPDGSRLTLTLPSLDLVSISLLCADFLRSWRRCSMSFLCAGTIMGGASALKTHESAVLSGLGKDRQDAKTLPITTTLLR